MLGEFVMQDAFLVWDAKQLIKKGRERQVFLFELCIVFSKRVEMPGKGVRYVYKNHLMVCNFFLSLSLSRVIREWRVVCRCSWLR